jgi:hypothetical protein
VRVCAGTGEEVKPVVRSLSQLAAIKRRELTEARKLRGGCRLCGHMWTPRNPYPTVNRCPGCGVRGHVEYTTLSTEEPPK